MYISLILNLKYGWEVYMAKTRLRKEKICNLDGRTVIITVNASYVNITFSPTTK